MATPVSLDDWRIANGEFVWRLIHRQYYVENPSMPGTRMIAAGAFAHNHKACSVVRANLVTIDFIKAHFKNFGIAAMKAEDVRLKANCLLAIEDDPTFSWPPDAHAHIYKGPSKKPLKPINWNALILLAEQGLILKPTV